MRIRSILFLLALLAASACDGGGTGAALDGGEYIAALQSPHGDEGGAMLEMTTGGVEDVSASSATLFRQPISDGVRLMLIRESAGRVEFRVVMAPGHELPTVRVVQVVDGDDNVRASTEGYQVTFTRTLGDP